MSKSFNDWAKPYAQKLVSWGITPNKISLGRLIGAQFVPFVYLFGGLFVTAGVVLLLAATDGLDGWLARLTGTVTALGKKLDALGDWALALPVALLLLYLGEIPLRIDAWQPWCLALILARNLALTFVYITQSERADEVSRPEDARLMSASLIIALAMLLISRTWGWLHLPGEICLGVATYFASKSWWQYFQDFRRE